MINKRVKYIAILCSIFLLSVYCNNEQIVEGKTMSNSETYKIKLVIGKDTLTAP